METTIMGYIGFIPDITYPPSTKRPFLLRDRHCPAHTAESGLESEPVIFP